MTVAEQKQGTTLIQCPCNLECLGLVAVHPIKAGFGVAELCGSVSVPSEVDSQPNPQVIFYSGIMDQTKDLPISEQPVICLDTRRISHDARHVRRYCIFQNSIHTNPDVVVPIPLSVTVILIML